MMQVSVVTPTLNMAQWLPLCVASVQDQYGVDVEHIVQDGGSTDQTVPWLREKTGASVEAQSGRIAYVRDDGSRYQLIWLSQQDKGMYDAINRGLEKTRGQICCYLNSDEQYLPHALKRVVDFLQIQVRVAVVFGDVVAVDRSGDYICSRQVLRPLYYHTKTCHLNTFTAAMFFRRSLLERNNLYFDPSWRNIGDAEWVLRVIASHVNMSVLPEYLSVFVDTGSNLNMQPSAKDESLRLKRCTPRWPHIFAFLWSAHHRLRRAFKGLYRPKPFSFSLYTLGNPDKRIVKNVDKPIFLWKERIWHL